MTGKYSRERAADLAVLGLPPQATRAEVVAAFRRLARAAHPDVTGRSGPGAAEGFTAISDAYHRLGDDSLDDVRFEASRRERRTRPVRPCTDSPPIVAGPVVVSPAPTRGRTPPGRS